MIAIVLVVIAVLSLAAYGIARLANWLNRPPEWWEDQ